MEVDLRGYTVLIIDDNEDLCQLIELIYLNAGAMVFTALTGQKGLDRSATIQPDLIILDINLPDISGWDVLSQIRDASNPVPIILLTTSKESTDMVRGLNLGADDFVSKPFDREVLLSRTAAVLRRSAMTPPQEEISHYADDHLDINLETRTVLAGGEPIKLTVTEFQLLAYLIKNAGQILSYQQILEEVWGKEYTDSIDYVHVYLSHLRRKLEKNPQKPQYFLTERGVGYMFNSNY